MFRSRIWAHRSYKKIKIKKSKGLHLKKNIFLKHMIIQQLRFGPIAVFDFLNIINSLDHD